jgi:hypothetical protein
MALKLTNLELVAPDDVQKLELAGVLTADDLIRVAAGHDMRHALARRSGISETILLRLARMADLMRIMGINEAHTQLLDALGAGCVAQLRQQDAAVLIKAMRRKNVEVRLVRSVPPESNLARWIVDANALPIVLEP